MQPNFKSQSLAGILSGIYHAERSGVLRLSRSDHEKRFHFDRGMIVFVESSVPEENLGSVLVRDGRISAGALSEAQRTLGDDSSAEDVARALVQRDLIGRATVSQAMAEIVDRVVQAVFGWEEGRAEFSERSYGESVFDTDILTTVEVILNGVASMTGFAAIHEALHGLDNRVRLCEPLPIPIERLTLSTTHGFILSRVDGQTTVSHLLSILPEEEEEVAARFLFGLLVLGVLEFDPPLADGLFQVHDLVRLHADQQVVERDQERAIIQKYEQIRHQNPYEILGVATSASRAEVARAYEQLKVQYGRDRVTPKVREQLRSQITMIESRLVEAFLTLSQPESPAPRRRGTSGGRPDASPDATVHDLAVRVELDRAHSKVEADNAIRIADNYFAKARKCMREGDFHNAIQYGKLAISHHPSDARYFGLLADCQARNPEARWQRMAEENYRRATQLDPWNPEYWTRLGYLYKKRGMKLRARKNFEEALKLVPNRDDLLRELASLES